MPGEGARMARVLEMLGRGVLAALDGLPEETLNQPVPLPEANTLYALATHVAGATEFWVLAMAGQQDIQRDRLAEFRASGTRAELDARYERWIAEVHRVLDDLPDATLGDLADLGGRYRPGNYLEPMTVGDCVLHAVEHTALHLGHIQITRQMLAVERM